MTTDSLSWGSAQSVLIGSASSGATILVYGGLTYYEFLEKWEEEYPNSPPPRVHDFAILTLDEGNK